MTALLLVILTAGLSAALGYVAGRWDAGGAR